MVGTRTTFTNEQTPCGQTADGQQYREEDEQGLIIFVREFNCGCRTSRHDYHDGSFHTQVVRHDKKKNVVDDFGPQHAV